MVFVLLPVSLLLAVLLLIPQMFGDFFAYQIGLYLIYGIAAQGIGYLWGKTGILPLGQALFFGVAAYAAALTLRDIEGLSAQLGVAVVVMAAISLLAFGLATLIFKGRSESGPYFSLITLALVMIAEQIANTASGLTGGFNGLSGFSSIGGLDPYSTFYYLIVGCTVLVSAALLVLNRLPVNLVVKGVADNEPRLQLLGFATHRIKGAAFAFSAVIAALAGGLFASHQGIVTPTSTGFGLSAELVILAAIGGRFHVLGPLFGAVLVGLASAELRDIFPYWEIVMALGFIVVVLKAPGGLAELIEHIVCRFWTPSMRGQAPRLNAPSPRAARVPAPLVFEDVKLQIGVVRILNGITFETPTEGIVSIIGPNGAGKTSALNTITGNLGVTEGHIRLGSTAIENRGPHAALGDGIGRKLQVPSVFFTMSVAENLTLAMLAGRAGPRDLFRKSTFGWQSDALLRVLANPNLTLQEDLEKMAGSLPQGHRQFLEFAMTTASEPTLLLLDEPCAGLSPSETAIMTQLVQEFQRKSGGLVIVIEHDMSIVEAISDKVVVLHQGQVLAFDSYEKVRADPQVVSVYAGATK
ncbi:MAG: ATP-binding cassette domain-containing protein [Ascidiaceihabitans sp.]|uniref:branched-chain amino acid ABC transporter ATP-binding protein/permease n=1 Tax=Ascidiaceihabitans sp. TaxID=1872644 RepID=UPI0032997013